MKNTFTTRKGAGTKTELFLSSKETAHHLGVSIWTLKNWRQQGSGPLYYRLPALRYRLADVEKFAESRCLKFTDAPKKEPSANSNAVKIVAATARLLTEGPRNEHVFAVEAFFNARSKKFIRAVLPRFKPDGKGRLVATCSQPDSRRMKPIKVYVGSDFRTWHTEDGARGDGAFSLVAWLFGPAAPQMLLAAAAAKTLLAREGGL